MEAKNLIDLDNISLDDLDEIIRFAGVIKENPTYFVDVCHGKIMATLFYEPSIRTLLTENNLTERHARCLLKIEDEELKERAIKEIISKNLNVSQTEVLIMSLMGELRKEVRKKSTKLRCVKLFKDLRIFSSTINQTIDLIKQTGIPVSSNKSETEDYIEYTIRIEKKA